QYTGDTTESRAAPISALVHLEEIQVQRILAEPPAHLLATDDVVAGQSSERDRVTGVGVAVDEPPFAPRTRQERDPLSMQRGGPAGPRGAAVELVVADADRVRVLVHAPHRALQLEAVARAGEGNRGSHDQAGYHQPGNHTQALHGPEPERDAERDRR